VVQGKTLVELRTELELGFSVYRIDDATCCLRRPSGSDGSFEAMFANLLASLLDADQPVWTTTRTPERLAFEEEIEREIKEYGGQEEQP
jgi:hypothetical protein